ncbi:MAG: alpha/beta hydrolase domain-containing protein [Caulobacterales bacterium]
MTGAALAAQITVSGPIAGAPRLGLGQFDLKSLGYVTEEYFLSGTATAYKRVGQPGEDGRWTAAPATTSPYVTRIVVVRPSDPAKFNGTVVVEWLNVTGGLDAPADWIVTHREMIRGGYAFVGVSAQRVGIEGGPSLMAGMPLKKADPARYGQLSHPGDAFAYDLYSQAGRVVRGEGSEGVLGPLRPKRVLSIGESQSAVFLTTYVNAIDPIAKVYDGFLIHSRFGGASTIEGAAFQGESASDLALAVKLREDLRAPVITVITETDLIGGQLTGFFPAQQPDNARLRIWEIPGTSHADTYIFSASGIDSGSAPIEALAAALKPTKDVFGTTLAFPMNSAPQHHYIVEAALWSLDRWVRTGEAPPKAPRVKAALGDKPSDPAKLTLDANGIAEGGVRTPWVDVPTARMSGVGNSGGALGFLLGVTEPFDQAKLDSLYPGGKAEYLKKFNASLTDAIASGFILPADKAEIEALGAAMYPGSK